MRRACNHLTALSVLICTARIAGAQTPAAQPDVMVLNDGEKVIGHLERQLRLP